MNRISELTYTPAWWVPGAHVQTLWGKFFRRIPTVPTRAERWATPDGDEIEIRRLDAAPSKSGRAPRLVILHGLEGTIRSHYLRGILHQAGRRGWAADVLIFRSCNGEVNCTRRMYHSGETTDVDLVVRRLIVENPDQPIVTIGFSLGGNVLLKWLGEQGRNPPSQLRAAVAISVPYDLERGARHIERGFSRIYTRHFLRTLRAKALAKLKRYPDLFDRGALSRATSLYEFDDAVTAPVHGFSDAHDYYTRSSCLQFVPSIHVPTLLLSALDDPFVPRDVFDDVVMVAGQSDAVIAELPLRGGHVGFMSGSSPADSHSYGEERAMEFFQQHLPVA